MHIPSPDVGFDELIDGLRPSPAFATIGSAVWSCTLTTPGAGLAASLPDHPILGRAHAIISRDGLYMCWICWNDGAARQKTEGTNSVPFPITTMPSDGCRVVWYWTEY